MSTDCLFCKIATQALPAPLIYADADIVAFNDIAPQAPIHNLIIPRRHIATVNDLNSADDQLLIGKLVAVAKQLAHDHGIADNGYRLLMNCNQDGGQSVFHIHLHLLAGRQLAWPPG